jgi:hypothetical protein
MRMAALRSRCNAGVVMTASPSQLTLRTRMRRGWEGGAVVVIASSMEPVFRARGRLQRLRTQNQLAGSRRTAA